MANYLLTNKAVEDLSEIWNYTYEIWSESQADRYYNDLIEICVELSKKQSLGKSYAEIRNEILGFTFNKHIIFYRVINPNEIEIVRILHGRMDLKRRLFEY